MTNKLFNAIVDRQLAETLDTLVAKGIEYENTVDRFHNIRLAADLQGINLYKSVTGMMSKHTVSIYDMIRMSDEKKYPIEQWREKIKDHINYLLFIIAIAEEEDGVWIKSLEEDTNLLSMDKSNTTEQQ